MGYIKLGRYILLGALAFFSFVILGISGNLLSQYGQNTEFAPVYLGLDLAMAVITLVVIVPSLVIDFFRKGAFTSMVIVEVAWSALLTIFWIAAAGETTAQLVFLPTSCTGIVGINRFGQRIINASAESNCRQEQALEALSWLNFIFILGWLVTLVFLAATKHSKGNTSVWKSSVTSSEFLGRGTAPSTNHKYQTTSAMQQQNMGHPQGYPPTNGYNSSAAQV